MISDVRIVIHFLQGFNQSTQGHSGFSSFRTRFPEFIRILISSISLYFHFPNSSWTKLRWGYEIRRARWWKSFSKIITKFIEVYQRNIVDRKEKILYFEIFAQSVMEKYLSLKYFNRATCHNKIFKYIVMESCIFVTRIERYSYTSRAISKMIIN